VDVQADIQAHKVTVLGKTDSLRVLKKARKFDKKADIVNDPPAAAVAEPPKAEAKKAEKVEEKAEKKAEEKPKEKAADNKGGDKGEKKPAEPTPPLPSPLPPIPAYRYYYPERPVDYWGHSQYAPSYNNQYRPSQSYPPHHYPQYSERDHPGFYTNPNYLKHIKHTYY
jgi:hypothetical protein